MNSDAPNNYAAAVATYLFTPLSRVLLEKLSGSQPVKKFPVFYGTPKVITEFVSAHHLCISWGRSIQSMAPHRISWRSNLILSSHLRLGPASGLFTLGIPTKTLYTPLPPYVLHAPPISFFSIWSQTLLGEEYSSLSSCLYFTTTSSSSSNNNNNNNSKAAVV